MARSFGLILAAPATCGLLAALTLLFALQMAFAFGELGFLLAPSYPSINAFGGASGNLVLAQGEWFRLLTHAFLHLNILHLAMNGLGLMMIGRLLEPLLGPFGFLALFIVCGTAGGVASVLWNPPFVVGVGASGAIMGAFGFALGFAFRIVDPDVRKRFQRDCLGVMLPTLAPAVIPGLSGLPIDHAAHFGGAAAGFALGVASRWYWPEPWRASPLGRANLALCIAALAVIAFAIAKLAERRPEFAYHAGLIPQAELPADDAAFRAAADDLSKRYPGDPRGRYALAAVLAQNGDLKGAETEIRAAVSLAERYPAAFTPAFRQGVRAYLAFVLLDLGRRDEARREAASLCGAELETRLRETLTRNRLCERR